MNNRPVSNIELRVRKSCKKINDLTSKGKSVTDDAYDRIKNMIGEDGGVRNKSVKISLSPADKNVIYHNILDMVKSKEKPQIITESVVKYIDELLIEKEKLIKGEKSSIDGPVFRRVE